MKAPTLKTERLILRRFRDDDFESIVRTITSDPEVMEHLPGDPQTAEEERSCARWYIEMHTTPWQVHGFGGWAVCSRTSDLAPEGTLLGIFGFIIGELKEKGPEIGYGYGKAYWGKGIATEAAKAGLDWFFLKGGHEHCYACTGRSHDSSKHDLQKIGLTHTSDEDLWGSVSQGFGLVPVFTSDRQTYFQSHPHPV